MIIAVGSDHAGFELKEELKEVLAALGHEVKDLGTATPDSCDYPRFAARVARSVAAGEAERGLLVCGTGIGMSMAANKVRGIRAALCFDAETARMSRAHNDANVLCLGARTSAAGRAREMVEVWLRTEFEGGRHRRRVDQIHALEAPEG